MRAQQEQYTKELHAVVKRIVAVQSGCRKVFCVLDASWLGCGEFENLAKRQVRLTP